ncbi:DNA-directed RNA polymerase sigma-70 factor [Dictyobacter sp. S3.2.2.5]|uniref:DNA-directed RNA polymerase sigma-70 factor n=1 Tax=Dictyobacter halimunensis TaxID=3026934 RepID=A0ABQ6G5H5_9CHLR|nr:DNA-directed RNA polymerase sigma-70 factor [Dictyobacter sp. S3.2.2.5]
MNKDQYVFFDRLYQEYYQRVLSYVRFHTGAGESAEDITSMVFERALTHLAELREPDATAAWLFRIARNCVTDAFRRSRPEVSLDELAFMEQPRVHSPEASALAREEQRLLLAQVARLSEREREIIGLKFVAHLTNRQIARVLGVPVGTVGSLLHRTLGKLRDALTSEGDAP